MLIPFTIKHRDGADATKRYGVIFPEVWSECLHLAPSFQLAMDWATRYQEARMAGNTHEGALEFADTQPTKWETVAEFSAKGNASPKRDRKASGAKMRATMIERYGPDCFKKIRKGEKPSA